MKHGTPTGYRYGCRCDACSAANRSVYYARKKRLWGTEPTRHGTYTAYQIHGCRCDECVEVNRASQRRARERWAAKLEAKRAAREAARGL